MGIPPRRSHLLARWDGFRSGGGCRWSLAAGLRQLQMPWNVDLQALARADMMNSDASPENISDVVTIRPLVVQKLRLVRDRRCVPMAENATV